MVPGARNCGIVLLVLALSMLALPVGAGDSRAQGTFGGNFFSASPPCPAKQLPTFESLVPVPGIVDPFEQDVISMFCQIQADREGKGVKKVNGKYETDLIVVNTSTGEAESFSIASGRFKTNKDGRANFDFDIPADLFADGFESGDVSAWSYTRTDFTNKKKVGGTSVSCNSSTTRSQDTTWVRPKQ